MKKSNFLQSNCRYCRYYQPEGRRGGACDKLGVEVEGGWTACAFACSPFEETWEQLDTTLTNLEKTLVNLEEIVHLETAFSLPAQSHGEDYTVAELPNHMPLSRNKSLKTQPIPKSRIMNSKKAPMEEFS